MNLAFLSCDINVTVVLPSCNHTMTINSTIIHTQCSTFTPLEYIFLQVAIHTTHSGIQCVSKSSTCNRLYSGRTLWMEGLFQADKGNWKCLGWFYIGAIALPNTPFTWLCYALHSVQLYFVEQSNHASIRLHNTTPGSCMVTLLWQCDYSRHIDKIAKQKNAVEMDKSQEHCNKYLQVSIFHWQRADFSQILLWLP